PEHAGTRLATHRKRQQLHCDSFRNPLDATADKRRYTPMKNKKMDRIYKIYRIRSRNEIQNSLRLFL
ncbi:MAG: hypothetical protein ACRET6_01745, partial [Burkholderiales bacterium]